MLTVAITGCRSLIVDIDATHVSKLMISYPSGGFVTTNRTDISELVSAMRKAEPDSTLYDTIKTGRIQFFSDSNLLYSVVGAGPLFDFKGQQFYERSGEMQRVVSELMNPGKGKQNQ